MNFIKNLLGKIKAFFSGAIKKLSFKSKPALTVAPAAAASAVVAEEVLVEEVVAAPAVEAEVVEVVEAAPVAAAEQDDLLELMNTIAQLAGNRNYQTDEAVEAYYAGDKATMVRIERAMRNKSYKAPGKNKKAKKAKAARFDELAMA